MFFAGGDESFLLLTAPISDLFVVDQRIENFFFRIHLGSWIVFFLLLNKFSHVVVDQILVRQMRKMATVWDADQIGFGTRELTL